MTCMKKLYIVRHTQKEELTLQKDDYDRQLNEQGVIDANNLAKKFADKYGKVDLISI